MRKPADIEEIIKKFIRDILADDPIMSVAGVRTKLFGFGCHAVYGPLDWAYVNKLMKKVRCENLIRLNQESRMERLSRLRERHRTITNKLMRIVDGDMTNNVVKGDGVYPTPDERVTAADAILKWDTAMFFAEEQARAIDRRASMEEMMQIQSRVTTPKQIMEKVLIEKSETELEVQELV